MIIWIIIFVVFYLLYKARNPKHPLQLNVYFGVPGSGKTTFAAYLAREAQRESFVIKLCRRYPCRYTRHILNKRKKKWKRAYPVWSNVPISGCYKLNAREDIGIHMIQDGKLIIDEAGVEFNNRNYKSFPQTAVKFFKYHRHYGVSVDVFSQSFDDMDVTLRRLAQNFYVVRRSLIPFFIVIKRIKRKVGIDDNTHQLVDAYSFGMPILDTQWIFAPPLWKMFDSYDYDELPDKKWKYWGQDEDVSFGTALPSNLVTRRKMSYAPEYHWFTYSEAFLKHKDRDLIEYYVFEELQDYYQGYPVQIEGFFVLCSSDIIKTDSLFLCNDKGIPFVCEELY